MAAVLYIWRPVLTNVSQSIPWANTRINAICPAKPVDVILRRNWKVVRVEPRSFLLQQRLPDDSLCTALMRAFRRHAHQLAWLRADFYCYPVHRLLSNQKRVSATMDEVRLMLNCFEPKWPHPKLCVPVALFGANNCYLGLLDYVETIFNNTIESYDIFIWAKWTQLILQFEAIMSSSATGHYMEFIGREEV